MPIVDAVVVAVLPDDCQRIRADGFNVGDARGRRIGEILFEYIGAGLGAHVLMAAAARGAGTPGAQQAERIDADVPVVPVHDEFAGLFVYGDVGRFFIHVLLLEVAEFNRQGATVAKNFKKDAKSHESQDSFIKKLHVSVVNYGAGTTARKSAAAQPARVSS